LLTSKNDKLFEFVRALGAEPRIVAADAHDRMLAFLSHLPQLTASALMQVVGDAAGEDGLALAGRGLADTTRLAASPADIWRDIASTNAEEIGAALDVLIERLQQLRRDLGSGDTLEAIFTEAARWREKVVRSAAEAEGAD
jgi:prephenate dehydrogenase